MKKLKETAEKYDEECRKNVKFMHKYECKLYMEEFFKYLESQKNEREMHLLRRGTKKIWVA